MNVLVVIHQPRYSVFQLFDSVLLLGMGGRAAFWGPVGLAEPYFDFLGFVPPPNENRAGDKGQARRGGWAWAWPVGAWGRNEQGCGAPLTAAAVVWMWHRAVTPWPCMQW